MKFRVIIRDEAIAAIDAYLDYLEEDSKDPIVAVRWWQKAIAKVKTLEYMPRRCPLAPENAKSELELRMLIVDQCLFVFHVADQDQAVYVVRFRHGSREV